MKNSKFSKTLVLILPIIELYKKDVAFNISEWKKDAKNSFDLSRINSCNLVPEDRNDKSWVVCIYASEMYGYIESAFEHNGEWGYRFNAYLALGLNAKAKSDAKSKIRYLYELTCKKK